MLYTIYDYSEDYTKLTVYTIEQPSDAHVLCWMRQHFGDAYYLCHSRCFDEDDNLISKFSR